MKLILKIKMLKLKIKEKKKKNNSEVKMKKKIFGLSIQAILTFVLCFVFAVIFWFSISYAGTDSLNIFELTYGL